MWYFVKHLFLQKKLICFGIQSQSYTLILFTWNILYSQLMLSKYFDQEFFFMNLFDYNFFLRFVLLYSSSTSNIYYGRYTDLRPKDFWMKGLGTQYFSRLQPWMSTTTATIERESFHLIQKSSNKSQPYETKTSRAKKEWSEMMKTQQPKPIGIIGKAYSFWLSCPYLTISKCA
jgi:hypothetical protein